MVLFNLNRIVKQAAKATAIGPNTTGVVRVVITQLHLIR